MKTTTATAMQTRAIEYVKRCQADFRQAMAERDAIEDCCSPAWKLAHSAAREAAVSETQALRHAYEVGALPKPYWV